jgi:putative transposase
MAENGVPEIIDSEQGSQYTSPSWTNSPERKEIKISMDVKGHATDNI